MSGGGSDKYDVRFTLYRLRRTENQENYWQRIGHRLFSFLLPGQPIPIDSGVSQAQSAVETVRVGFWMLVDEEKVTSDEGVDVEFFEKIGVDPCQQLIYTHQYPGLSGRELPQGRVAVLTHELCASQFESSPSPTQLIFRCMQAPGDDGAQGAPMLALSFTSEETVKVIMRQLAELQQSPDSLSGQLTSVIQPKDLSDIAAELAALIWGEDSGNVQLPLSLQPATETEPTPKVMTADEAKEYQAQTPQVFISQEAAPDIYSGLKDVATAPTFATSLLEMNLHTRLLNAAEPLYAEALRAVTAADPEFEGRVRDFLQSADQGQCRKPLPQGPSLRTILAPELRKQMASIGLIAHSLMTTVHYSESAAEELSTFVTREDCSLEGFAPGILRCLSLLSAHTGSFFSPLDLLFYVARPIDGSLGLMALGAANVSDPGATFRQLGIAPRALTPAAHRLVTQLAPSEPEDTAPAVAFSLLAESRTLVDLVGAVLTELAGTVLLRDVLARTVPSGTASQRFMRQAHEQVGQLLTMPLISAESTDDARASAAWTPAAGLLQSVWDRSAAAKRVAESTEDSFETITNRLFSRVQRQLRRRSSAVTGLRLLATPLGIVIEQFSLTVIDLVTSWATGEGAELETQRLEVIKDCCTILVSLRQEETTSEMRLIYCESSFVPALAVFLAAVRFAPSNEALEGERLRVFGAALSALNSVYHGDEEDEDDDDDSSDDRHYRRRKRTPKYRPTVFDAAFSASAPSPELALQSTLIATMCEETDDDEERESPPTPVLKQENFEAVLRTALDLAAQSSDEDASSHMLSLAMQFPLLLLRDQIFSSFVGNSGRNHVDERSKIELNLARLLAEYIGDKRLPTLSRSIIVTTLGFFTDMLSAKGTSLATIVDPLLDSVDQFDIDTVAHMASLFTGIISDDQSDERAQRFRDAAGQWPEGSAARASLMDCSRYFTPGSTAGSPRQPALTDEEMLKLISPEFLQMIDGGEFLTDAAYEDDDEDEDEEEYEYSGYSEGTSDEGKALYPNLPDSPASEPDDWDDMPECK